MDGQVAALVLAGSRRGEKDGVARAAGVSCKAFAPVGGRPMIERVLEALLDHTRVATIDVALAPGVEPVREAPRLAQWLDEGRVQAVTAGSSPAGTVGEALRRSPDDLLVTTADHALLTRTMLEQFLAGCGDRGIDAFAALLPLALLEARYPEAKRTGLRMRDGRYSGCNLFMLRRGQGARSLVSLWLALEAKRKTPWRMARAVGPAALAGYALGLLTLPRAMDWIGGRAGARVAPVILDIPEAAIDVDTPQDLALVEKVLSRAAD